MCPGCAHLLVSQETAGCTYGCAQQGSLAQTRLALPSREDCGALHCSLIDMQRDPQQLLRGVLSLAVGCPLSTALQPLFKLGSSPATPPIFTETWVRLMFTTQQALDAEEGFEKPHGLKFKTLLQASGFLPDHILRVMCFLCSHAAN